MKYYLIIGKDYRDCKAKLEQLGVMPDVKFTLVTKAKHVSGIGVDGYYLTPNAQDNPELYDIMEKAGRNKLIKDFVPEAPIIDTKPKIVIEEPSIISVSSEDFVEIAEEDVKTQEEFEEELNTLIEKEEESGEIMVEEESGDELIVSDTEANEEVPVEEVVEAKPELEPGMNVDGTPYDMDEKTFMENAEPVVDEMVLDKIEEIPEKPAGDPPRGWHRKLEYVDIEGNLWSKGEYMGKAQVEEDGE